jgi:hypothetical protein
MKRVIALLLALMLTASATISRGADPETRPAAETKPAFAFVDVFVDPHGKPLAAYQFELSATAADVKLVGIEGGEHAAFAKPPFYDPKALLNERIVIAALSTAADLPSGKTRVARLMVRVGDGKPKYDVTLQVAASSDAKPMAEATVSISEGAAQ